MLKSNDACCHVSTSFGCDVYFITHQPHQTPTDHMTLSHGFLTALSCFVFLIKFVSLFKFLVFFLKRLLYVWCYNSLSCLSCHAMLLFVFCLIKSLHLRLSLPFCDVYSTFILHGGSGAYPGNKVMFHTRTLLYCISVIEEEPELSGCSLRNIFCFTRSNSSFD